MAEAEPILEFNEQLWQNAMNDVKTLYATINTYVRTYVNTYETLRESFMNSYTEKPLNLLRQGANEEMKLESEKLYARIYQNSISFQAIFRQIGDLIERIRQQQKPKPDHEQFLILARQQVPGLRTQIMQLENQIGAIRNEVIDREQYFGMMTIYRPPRLYPPEIEDWFPSNENGTTTRIDWYRHVHQRLIEQLQTTIESTEHSAEVLYQRQEALIQFCHKHLSRLEGRIPDITTRLQSMQDLESEIRLQKGVIRIQRHVYLPSKTEESWRHSLWRLKQELLSHLDKIEAQQIQLLKQFTAWKDEYVAAGEIDLNDIFQEFDETFIED